MSIEFLAILLQYLKEFKGAVSDGEMDFIKSITPGGSALNAISNLKKLLEEENK